MEESPEKKLGKMMEERLPQKTEYVLDHKKNGRRKKGRRGRGWVWKEAEEMEEGKKKRKVNGERES